MDKNPVEAIYMFYPTLPKVPKKIADYILEDTNRLLDISVQQMAQDLGIAESSIVRFCKIIGFTGFSEMKMMLAKYSSQQPPTVFDGAGETDTVESVTRNAFARNIDTLQKAVELLDFRSIEAASELLRRADRIIVCGIGTSASIAESFAVHLMRLGLPAEASTDSELMQISARHARPGTVLIAVSKSGRSIPIINAFRLARRGGVKTVCMTGYENTPLGKLCDVCIVHYCPVETLVSTRVVQNTLIDCLCLNAIRNCRQQAIENLAANRRVVKTMWLGGDR